MSTDNLWHLLGGPIYLSLTLISCYNLTSLLPCNCISLSCCTFRRRIESQGKCFFLSPREKKGILHLWHRKISLLPWVSCKCLRILWAILYRFEHKVHPNGWMSNQCSSSKAFDENGGTSQKSHLNDFDSCSRTCFSIASILCLNSSCVGHSVWLSTEVLTGDALEILGDIPNTGDPICYI